MSDKKTFMVAMIGVPDHERNVLKNIFKLSLYRANTYTLASIDEQGHILIVDADDAAAMAQWRALHGDAKPSSSTNPGATTPPPISVVMVTREKLTTDFPHYIHRPFVATRVLGILDQVAAQTPNSTVQERIIGGESPEPPPEQPPPSALVVDDSSTVRTQIAMELKLLGVQVEAVESGEQAFELLAHNSYDMVFLDVVLPGVDGYQICKTIKKNKITKQTPVIMLTSKSSPFDRIKGALAGCNTYLTKPVKQSSFQKTVKKYLKSP
ncbi:MAG: response regulator [Candidatus Competibacteraceae bacterium]|nr:MAG: response regulator [Candidatus Competibacteraceae bacterium]